MLSVLVFVIETVDSVNNAMSQSFWNYAELFFVLLFTLEYMARLLSSPAPGAFVRGPMNVIDLISILPFYIELIISLFPSVCEHLMYI